MSANNIPQYGPGPIPENSNTFMFFSGPICKYYSKTLYFTNRLGSNVSELIKAKIIAIDVNTPNNTGGKKFDKDKIQNPAAIVDAV